MVDAGASAEERAELALRLVIFGGEALESGSRCGAGWNGDGEERPQLVNMYGITETTVHVTQREVSLAVGGKRAPGSLIGKALDDLQLYLLDEQMELLPAGSVGRALCGWRRPGARVLEAGGVDGAKVRA